MLLPYNERARTSSPCRRRKWIETITDGGASWLASAKFSPTLQLCPPLTFRSYRRDSPSRGMHNDILAIKQLRLHAFRWQMPFIHGAVNLCLRQKFNFDAGRSSILFQLSAVSQRLLSLNWNVEKLFSLLLRKKDLNTSAGFALTAYAL